MQPIIDVENLRKVYTTRKRESGVFNAVRALFKKDTVKKPALKGISFKIEAGEIVGFIGPNGAGKSTTIKALSGVLYPTSGLVKVLNFVPWKDRVDYVKNIGVVFGQKEQLWWDLPAADTFYLNRYIYDVPKVEFEKRMKKMVRHLDLEEVSKKPVRDLSLGERMKCKLVAALLHKPKLVFLDEPSIGLDVIAKNRLRDFIIEFNEKYGTTFIITTHDMQEIERLCKRIIIINKGEIVYDGSLNKIKKKYMTSKIVDVKLESPAQKFKLPGCNMLEAMDYEMKIELDTRKQTVKEVIDYLLAHYDVADINILDPPIEEIIERIYKNG